MKPKSNPFRRNSLPLALMVLAASQPALAATKTWTTGTGANDGKWSSGSNWGGAIPANTTDTPTFGATTGLTALSVDLTNWGSSAANNTANYLSGITFTSGASAYTITLTNPLSITNPGSITVNSGVSNDETFTGGTIYVGTGTSGSTVNFVNNGTGKLIINSAIAGGASGASTNDTIAVNGTGNVELNGIISNGNGATAVLTKTGTNLLTVTGVNTYTGNTNVSGGTLSLSGANGSILNSAVIVNTGGTLKLDNTSTVNNTDRLSNTLAVTMNGGTLNFSNNGGAVNYSESAGQLLVNSGVSTVTTSQAAVGQTSTLTFASLGRTNTGNSSIVDFTGTGLGVDARNRIIFTSNPTLTNGIITNSGVAGWATYGGGANFASYDATNGVIQLAGQTDIAALGSTIADGSTSNVRINSAGSGGNIALGASTVTVNSLLQASTTAATVDTASKTLRTLTIMMGTGQGAVTIGTTPGSGTLTAATSGGTLTVNNLSSNTLTINSVIANNTTASGLTLLGGNVILNSTNTFTGTANVNGGTVVVGSNNAFGTGVLQITPGATIQATTDVTLANSSVSIAFGTTNFTGSNSITFGGTTPGFIGGGNKQINNTLASGKVLTFTGDLGMNNNATIRTLQIGGTGDTTFSGILSNGGGGVNSPFLVNSTGTTTFSGSNTFTGATTVSAGKLVLDYGTNNNSKISSTAVLTLQGGELQLKGGSFAQAVLSTTLNSGQSALTKNGGTSTIALGAFTFTNGALNLGAGGIATTTTLNGANNGLLGNNARVTVGAADWAVSGTSGTNSITAYTGYTTLTNIAGSNTTNYVLTSTLSPVSQGMTLSTLKIAPTTSGQTLEMGVNTLTLGNATAGGGSAGLLFTGSNDFAINGTGNLTAASGNVFLQDWGTGVLTLNLKLNSVLEKYGTGKVILAAAANNNTAIFVHAGTLQYSADNQLSNGTSAVSLNGSFGTGAALIANTAGGNIVTSRAIALGTLGGNYIDVIGGSGGNTLTLSGVISGNQAVSTANNIVTFGGASAVDSTNNGATNGVIFLSGANTYQGGTTFAGGLVQLFVAENAGTNGPLGATGTLTFTGGTLQFSSNNTFDYSSRFNQTGNQQFKIDTNSQNVTFASALVGAGSTLTKSGPGNLTLSGTNSYTGATTITTGTLSVGLTANLGAAASNLVFDGGTLQITGTTLTNVSGIGHAVSFNATKTVGLDINAAGNTFTVDQVLNQTTGGFTKLGAGTVVLNQTNTYTGTTTISAGTLVTDTAGINGSSTTNGLAFGGGTLKAATSGGISTNKAITATSTILLDTTNGNISLGGNIASTSNGLTLSGGNILTLSGTNSHTGATSVNGGTLALTNANAVQSSAVTLSNGTTLQLKNNSPTSFSSSGAVALSSVAAQAVTIDVGNNGSGTGNALTLANGISYAGPSSGILTGTYTTQINITGANSYALSVPSVTFGNGGSYGSGSPRNFVLDINPTSASVSVGSLTLTGSGSRVTVALTLDGTATGNIVTGAISLPTGRPVTKAGSGTWSLSGANAYDGTTTVSGGQLNINNAGSGGTSSAIGTGALTLSGGNLDNTSGAAIVLSTNNALNINSDFTFVGSNGANSNLNFGNGTVTLNASHQITVGSGATLTLGGNITGSGYTLTKAGAGTLVLNGSSAYTGPTLVNNGVLSFANVALLNSGSGVTLANGTSLVYTGGIGSLTPGVTVTTGGTGTISNTGSGTLTLGALSKDGSTLVLQGGAGGITVGGVISGSSPNSDLVIDGGTTTLTTAETYNGPTTIKNGGKLIMHGNTATLPATTDLILDPGSSTGSTFQIDNGGANQTVGSLTGAASSIISLDGQHLTVGGNNSDTVYAGVIHGTNNSQLIKTGTGKLTLSGTSDYQGGTSIEGGVLSISSRENLGNTGSSKHLDMTNGGTLQTTATMTFNTRIFDLGSGGGQFDVASGTTLGTAGTIQGAGALTKKGDGTMVLPSTGTFTGFTGNTNVNAGKLIVNGNISTSPLTTVNSAGTLGGTGTVGTATVYGSIAPGDTLTTIGTLHTGALTLDGGSFSNFEIQTGNISDLAVSSALLTFGGTLTVSNIGGALVMNDTFNLFDWGSETGTFSTVNLPSLNPGLTWNTSNLYVNGTITVVPEPDVATLIGGIGMLCLLRRRR